jgi:hypothetical protein
MNRKQTEVIPSHIIEAVYCLFAKLGITWEWKTNKVRQKMFSCVKQCHLYDQNISESRYNWNADSLAI